MKDLTIARLKNTSFSKLYSDFLLNKNIDNIKYKKILSIATIFINSSNEYIKLLGYRIIIIYCNQTNDYKPLYEISINWGLIPVSKFIESINQSTFSKSVFTELNSSFQEIYHFGNLYYSEQQKELNDFYFEKMNSTISVIAPTSYGKTDLIISTLRECKNKNICVITPTKSLLLQTKIRIMNAGISWINKIITHPEMYNDNDRHAVAVLTQERVLRLLKKAPNLYFDYVVIDEAHGLLNDEARSTLLASTIILLEKRNKKTVFKFLTPFLCDANNLRIKYTDYKLEFFSVSEHIKTERLYIYDTRKQGEFCIYDQFLDEFYPIEMNNCNKDDIDFIEYYKAYKNIIYLNKPIDIEDSSSRLLDRLPKVVSEIVDKACKNISEYMHPEYDLISNIERGVIYHHGSVPDVIRIYIENLYSTVNEIMYVVTSSTLLEGVNLPAEKMFVLDNKKGHGNLTPSNFKNLIGRVCRFSEIFKPQNENLKKLEPSIYLVVGKYYSKNANAKQFLKTCTKIDKKVKDEPKNILLVNTNIKNIDEEKLKNSQEFIENFENGIIENYKNRYVETEVGKSCFLNLTNELNIFDIEVKLQRKVDVYHKQNFIIDNTDILFDVLNNLFFSNMVDNGNNQDLIRFKYLETRNFYKMFLNWRIKNASYNEIIASFINHWNKLINGNKDTLIYVGRWGDTCREGIKKLWTDIKTKSHSQKINLAIVRIKEEQDFLDNNVMKYIEVLHDIKLIKEDLFFKIKFGTDDLRKITLLKNGISLSLANLLVDKYLKFININLLKNTVIFNKNLISEMLSNEENEIFIYESKYFTK